MAPGQTKPQAQDGRGHRTGEQDGSANLGNADEGRDVLTGVCIADRTSPEGQAGFSARSAKKNMEVDQLIAIGKPVRGRVPRTRANDLDPFGEQTIPARGNEKVAHPRPDTRPQPDRPSSLRKLLAKPGASTHDPLSIFRNG